MATVNPYLTFNGNCEEAFNFYKSVFGGEFSTISRYKDMPSDEPIPESEKEKIMHVYLRLSKETALMGCDASGFCGEVNDGDNISLSISAESEEEARSIFDALSAGGLVTMPLEKVFWGALFGSFTDKFGINWMISHEYRKEPMMVYP